MAAKADLAFNIFARDRNAEKVLDKIGNSALKTAAKFRILNVTTTKTSKTQTELKTRITGVSTALPALAAKTIAVGGALSVAAASAASATASLVSFAAAIAPAVGILAAVPTAVGVAAAAMSTLKVATAGAGDAFGAALADDAEAFEASLEGLSENAVAAARALRELKPEFDALQDSVQDAFFEGLDETLTSVAETLMGPIREGMTGAAGAMGEFVQELAQVAEGADAVEFLTRSFRSVENIVDNLSSPVAHLVESLLKVGNAVADMFGGTNQGAGLGRLIDRFADFLEVAAESGKAVEWVEGAIAVFSALGDIIGSIVGIFGSIGAAAESAGGSVLGVFGAALEGVDKFLSSMAGQESLTKIFEALTDVGDALGPVIASLGVGLATIAPVIADIATAAGPALVNVFDALAPALAGLGKGLVPVFEALETALGDLDLEPLGIALGGVLASVAPLIEPLGILVQLVADGLTGAAKVVAPALEAIAAAVTPVVKSLSTSLTPVIERLAPKFADLFESTAPILAAIGEHIAELLPPILSVLELGLVPLELGLETLAAIWAEAGPVLDTFLDAFDPLKETIAEVTAVFADLGVQVGEKVAAAIVELAPKFSDIALAAIPLIEKVTALAPLFGDIAIVLVEELLPVILEQLIPTLVDLAAENMDDLIPAIVTLIETLAELTPVIIPAVVMLLKLGAKVAATSGEFLTFALKVAAAIGSFVGNVFSGIKRVIGWFTNLGDKISAAVRNFGQLLIPSGKGLMQGLLSGIDSKMEFVGAKMRSVGRTVSGSLNKSLDINSPSKVTRYIGEMAGLGVAEGITATTTKVAEAAAGLSSSALPDLGGTGHVSMSTSGAPFIPPPSQPPPAAPAMVLIDLGGVDDQFAAWLKRRVKIDGGGNVQVAFGQRGKG